MQWWLTRPQARQWWRLRIIVNCTLQIIHTLCSWSLTKTGRRRPSVPISICKYLHTHFITHCPSPWLSGKITTVADRYCCLRRRRRLCFYFGLFVCPSDNWKSCERILTKFLEGVEHGPGTKGINFDDDLDHHPDLGVWSPGVKTAVWGWRHPVLGELHRVQG